MGTVLRMVPPLGPLPPPMLLGGLTVQRFNAATDDATKATVDDAHPALAGLGITKLGPYEFNPMSGRFKYAPAVPAAGPKVKDFLRGLLKDRKVATPVHQPERAVLSTKPPFRWTNPSKPKQKITFYPAGVTPARPADRIPAARNLYLTAKVSFKAGAKKDLRIVGKVLDAMKSHGGGLSPRPFRTLAQEDVLGAAGNAHNMSRHVVGGADMPDETAVAVRAAFGLIGGLGGHGAMYSKTASAFASAADANRDVGLAVRNELIPNWKAKYATQIVTDGGVTLKVPRSGGKIVAYQSTAGKWPAAQIPTYLDATKAGQKPLYYPDARYDAWATTPAPMLPLSAAQYALNKGTPLTTDASGTLPNVNVRIVSSDDPATGGWFINSAYPCK